MTLTPTNRLLLAAIVLGVPGATAVGWLSGSPAMATLGLAALLLPTVLDALLGLRQAKGTTVSLVVDPRATQGREFPIKAIVSGGGKVQVAIDPPEGWEGALAVQNAGHGPETRAVQWDVTPRDRGRHTLEAIYHECISPLGLWAWRSRTPCHAEVRVYPDLRTERGTLAPLFLRKAAIGLHRTRSIGKGREFEQLREYLPGDGYEDIEWKATARRGKPVTKVHQIERSQDVYFIIDASRRSTRRLTELEHDGGGPAPSQMDRFVRAGLALSLAALQQGDRPGLAIFRSSLSHFIRAGGGTPQYNAIRDKLYALQATPKPPDFADLFAELRNRIRHRALLVFLTDLDDPVLSAQFSEEVAALARHHLVLVGQVQSKGVAPVFSRDDAPTTDEEVYRRVGGHLLWEGSRQTRAKLRTAGVHCVTSPAEDLIASMVSAYLDLKRRQLL